jgi:hypothetical protein
VTSGFFGSRASPGADEHVSEGDRQRSRDGARTGITPAVSDSASALNGSLGSLFEIEHGWSQCRIAATPTEGHPAAPLAAPRGLPELLGKAEGG